MKPTTVPATLTKTDFAAHLGVGKSYVSALNKAGRLVLTDDGLVRVAAQSAAQYAQYAESAAQYAKIRQQIINAAYEYLDAALPKRECTNGAVLKRAEKLAGML